MAKAYVLDTSAIFTYTEEEEGIEEVHRLLLQAQRKSIVLFLPFMTLMEAYYRRWQVAGENAAKDLLLLLKQLPAQPVEYSEELLLHAGRLKALHAISLGDAWIAGVAQLKGATLVHKDPEFESLANLIPMLTLPYKR